MIILGVDGGTRITGFSIIKVNDEKEKRELIYLNSIQSKIERSTAGKLNTINKTATKLIEKYKPDFIVFERPRLARIFNGGVSEVNNAGKIPMIYGAIMSNNKDNYFIYGPVNSVYKFLNLSHLNRKKREIRKQEVGAYIRDYYKAQLKDKPKEGKVNEDSLDAVAIALSFSYYLPNRECTIERKYNVLNHIKRSK